MGVSLWDDVLGILLTSVWPWPLTSRSKLSVFLNMNSCPNFFVIWGRHTILGKWVYQYETMCRVYWWPLYDLDLWPQCQNYSFFNWNSCPGHNFFVLCHMHPVFGTWMHHHETMCHVLCLSVRLRVLIRAITSLFFDVCIPYLAYGCINMRGCIAYIHDLHVTFNHMTLTFDLKVKGISFLTWIIFGMWVYHHEKVYHLH